MAFTSFKDESGIQRGVFNKSSVERILHEKKIQPLELIIIGALLYQIDGLLTTSPQEKYFTIDKTQYFSEMNLYMAIILDWDLTDSNDIKCLLTLHGVFQKNIGRFREEPEPTFSAESLKMLQQSLR